MKNKLYLFVILFFGLPYVSTAQGTGTLSDPFTILGQALTVPSAGIYYFNLSGNNFSTYVDASGYVQVARDYGNGSGNLPQSTTLNSSTRGILTPTILATLNGATDVKISTSRGTNVTTTNATIISRVANNLTLHKGAGDNGINSSWVGTNAATFNGTASCNSPNGTSLHQNVYHPCGNASTFHWMPSTGTQRDPWNLGEIGNTEFIVLWVRDNSSPLPIELIDFTVLNNKGIVEIHWQTASERNNEYFTVEKSKTGEIWDVLLKQPGAGNSTHTLAYFDVDDNPFLGISYYRLKQTDFDGKSAYSDVKSVEIGRNEDLNVFPVPAKTDVYISGLELAEFKLIDVQGREKDIRNLITRITDETIQLNVRGFSPGFYFIVTETQYRRLIVE